MTSESVRHVRDNRADVAGTAWCGAPIALALAFSNVDQALQSVRIKAKPIVCPDCLEEISDALALGREP
jgi:hypothetical protein